MSSAARHSARDLVASGLLDLDWIAAQLGTEPGSAEDAARAVINTPDISPHPLFEATWLPGKGVWQAGELPPSLWYVTEGPRRNRLAPHPLINTERIHEENAAARDHEFGPLAWWAAHATRDTPLPVRRGYPHISWGEFRDNALRAAREWQVLSYLDANPGAHQHSPETTGPVVTVLMSAQDVGPLLGPTIAALQAQTLDQWELLVLDRGSIDATGSIASDVAARDSRVRVIMGSRTQLGRTFNRGLQRARGEFVAFLEPGHLWHPEYLARGVGVLRAGDSSAVHAFPGRETRLSGELVTTSQFDLGTTLLRRSVLTGLGGFDEGESEETVADLVRRLRSGDLEWANPLVLLRGVTEEAPETVNWEAAQATARVVGQTSVVLPMGTGSRGTIDWLLAGSADVDVVVVTARDRRGPHLLTSALAGLLPGVTSVSVPAGTSISSAMNIGIAHSSGDTVVLVRPEAQPAPGIIGPLAAAVHHEGVALVQPLVLDRRGLILSAGAGFPRADDRLGLLFSGHPTSDARRLGRTEIPAPASPVVALEASRLTALRGLDPHFEDALAETDLGLRALATGAGHSLLVPDVTVTSRTAYADPADLKVAMSALRSRRHQIPEDRTSHLWRAAGFEVTGVRTQRVSADPEDPESDSVLLQQHVVRRVLGIDESPPRLRWTIDTAAPAGPRGERWGDTHFARSLAAALERCGQDVSVDSRDARHRTSREHDDVVLVLRGLDLVAPHPDALNMEWIISHPDLVTAEEIKGFDLVYAASVSWPTQVRRDWGLRVSPLLQCTDPRYFHPDRGVPDTGPAVLFVGNSRGVFRHAVRTALAADADLTVHGADWDEYLDPQMVASSGVPNDEVGVLYASAGVVLNDHHVDMRRDSFLSNRLFDAAACGARIATDEVSGLDETFGALVQPFADEHDLARLVRPPYTAFPDNETRRELARRIVAEHTFDQRAATLVEDAVTALRARQR
ncbi:glycosyltransferase [Nocardioides terrigena]|uniref:glycosyltransferase n=1 Tax=Nocardioides terrigena TaxID=424797 RepID=UPI000D306AB4|nr:glycosyltransferase [Nocardioides terrigena]